MSSVDIEVAHRLPSTKNGPKPMIVRFRGREREDESDNGEEEISREEGIYSRRFNQEGNGVGE